MKRATKSLSAILIAVLLMLCFCVSIGAVSHDSDNYGINNVIPSTPTQYRYDATAWSRCDTSYHHASVTVLTLTFDIYSFDADAEPAGGPIVFAHAAGPLDRDASYAYSFFHTANHGCYC